MYRCTECNTEYEVCPDYCECGNDSFEEVVEDTYEEEYYEPPRPVRRPPQRRKRRELTPEEIEDMEEEKADKQKALITIIISLILCVVCLFLPPHKGKKIEKVKERAEIANLQIPDVNSFWDNSLPAAFRKSDPDSNLPLLNRNFSYISNSLRSYLVNIGEEFSYQWNPQLVDGSGECQVQFTINKDGVIGSKKIIARSRNESLDDSVLLLLSKVTNLDTPPDDYKGERIILSFKIDGKTGSSKVYYPVPKR